MRNIRTLSIVVIQKNHSILVMHGSDPVSGLSFYRPVGGGVEFGETAKEAAVREVREELDCDIENVKFLGILESIFSYGDCVRHEVIFVHEASFADPSSYQVLTHKVTENNGYVFTVDWHEINSFGDDKKLVPNGLLELIKQC